MGTTKKDALAEAIKAGNKALCAHLAAGDAAAMAGCYTADAVVMPPNARACKGRRAITAYWRDAMAAGVRRATLRTVTLEQHGATAIERGEATLKGDRGVVLDKAKYVVVWKREGRAWKLHVDIFNSNLPAA